MLNPRKPKTDWRRVALLAGAMGISVAIGYKFQPVISGSKEAVNAVITIFSILAGFLMASISLTADAALRKATSWEDLQLRKRSFQRRLWRQRTLFFLYLITLALALTLFLVPSRWQEARTWGETIFLTLSCFVMLLSFTLPGSLIQLQMDRYTEELEAKKPSVLTESAMSGRPPQVASGRRDE